MSLAANNAIEIWEKASEHLKCSLSPDVFECWIAGIVPLKTEEDTFHLGVSNQVFSEWLDCNYRDLIVQTILHVSGSEFDIKFEAGHVPKAKQTDTLAPPQNKPKQATVKKHSTRTTAKKLGCSPLFKFDTFIVGDHNRFAHAASWAVATTPGAVYNPLFIYGGTGLGKTHLLQSVAQHVAVNSNMTAKIEYLTSEDFANAFIDAIKVGNLPKFRDRFRNVDLLLIDDVQFFTGKERFQEEFFHTFNTLFNAHKQIVLTSDRPPNEIDGLEKRLVSRFEWGLTCAIEQPDYETRLAILKAKQDKQNVKLAPEVLHFVATHIKSNVRRLEGALIRLVSYESLTGQAITVEAAATMLRPLLDDDQEAAITPEKVLKVVASHYDIRLSDLTSRKRTADIAQPRQVAMYLCRKCTDLSTPVIGERFNRNHATVLHATQKVESRLDSDNEFQEKLRRIESTLRAK